MSENNKQFSLFAKFSIVQFLWENIKQKCSDYMRLPVNNKMGTNKCSEYTDVAGKQKHSECSDCWEVKMLKGHDNCQKKNLS